MVTKARSCPTRARSSEAPRAASARRRPRRQAAPSFCLPRPRSLVGRHGGRVSSCVRASAHGHGRRGRRSSAIRPRMPRTTPPRRNRSSSFSSRPAPASAELILDGAKLEHPFSGQLPKDRPRLHRLEARAPVARRKRVWCSLDQDLTLHLELLVLNTPAPPRARCLRRRRDWAHAQRPD